MPFNQSRLSTQLDRYFLLLVFDSDQAADSRFLTSCFVVFFLGGVGGWGGVGVFFFVGLVFWFGTSIHAFPGSFHGTFPTG